MAICIIFSSLFLVRWAYFLYNGSALNIGAESVLVAIWLPLLGAIIVVGNNLIQSAEKTYHNKDEPRLKELKERIDGSLVEFERYYIPAFKDKWKEICGILKIEEAHGSFYLHKLYPKKHFYLLKTLVGKVAEFHKLTEDVLDGWPYDYRYDLLQMIIEDTKSNISKLVPDSRKHMDSFASNVRSEKTQTVKTLIVLRKEIFDGLSQVSTGIEDFLDAN